MDKHEKSENSLIQKTTHYTLLRGYIKGEIKC